jgi:arylsulfatase A-like enzyme
MLVMALGSTGCARSPTVAQLTGRRPDIILITVDALRADHLGIYGYDRPTSPSIDAFARGAVVVRDHISQAPYTKASMASLFTGLFPTAHKVVTSSVTFAAAMTGHVAGSLPTTDVLDAEATTLAEQLAAAGYQTVGLDTNPFLLREFGFAQGFSDYEFLSDESNVFTRAADVVARALQVVDGRDRSRPLFVWLHLMEPHSPYTPAEPFRSLFPPRTPPLRVPPETIPPWLVVQGSSDAHVYEALYDAEIREADDALGALFAGLRSRRAMDTSIVVLTADHGEEFFDHGGFEHNRTLYEEMIRVPLIVAAPGLTPGIRDAQTEAVDMMPTLLVQAGARVPERLQGADVWPVLQGKSRGERYAYSENPGVLYSLRTREWKFISTLQGGHHLYRIDQDPHEQQDLAATHPEETERYRDLLVKILASAATAGKQLRGQSAPIQPRVLQRLKALGYVQ